MIRFPVHKFTSLCCSEAQEYVGFAQLISLLRIGSGLLQEQIEKWQVRVEVICGVKRGHGLTLRPKQLPLVDVFGKELVSDSD